MLLVGAERMSRIMDWEDRSTCVIFGDGAGAVVLGEGDNYLTSKLYSRGGDDVIKIPQFIGKSPFYEREPMKPYIHMKGQETFKFAVNAMCADVRDVMAEAGMTGEDVAWVVPIRPTCASSIWPAKSWIFPTSGSSSTSTGTATCRRPASRWPLTSSTGAGCCTGGDNLVLCGFGGGLSSAACVLRW